MGLLRKIINASTRKTNFVPDLKKTEYDNWLDYLAKGGTTQEWNKLKKENRWKFKKDKVESSFRKEKEFRPVFNQYLAEQKQLKADWSVMYHEKNYGGKRAQKFEVSCLQNIQTYKKIAEIEDKYGDDHLTEVEGYKRLGMLYERQGEFAKAAAICRESIIVGGFQDAKYRLERMIKKEGREPTEEEMELLK